jgi:hypothetical protein
MKLYWINTDNNWAWTELMFADSSNNATHISGNDGYIEYTVADNTALQQLQKGGIIIQGGNLIPLMITVDNAGQ